jgi:hypothetical protein
LGGHRDQVEIVIGEEPRIHREVSGFGQQLKQLVGQPVARGKVHTQVADVLDDAISDA